jgi:hypothetical protein
MRSTPYVIPALLLSSLVAGCGGGASVTCPDGSTATTVPGSDFVGLPYAESGTVCLTQTPLTGFPFLGRYMYDDFGTPSEPEVFLDGPSNSTFQSHGVSARPIQWGVAVNEDGKLVGQSSANGAIVYLFYKFTGPGRETCTPGLICDPEETNPVTSEMNVWQAGQLSVSFTKQEMYIYGERILPCSTNGGCSYDASKYYWPN